MPKPRSSRFSSSFWHRMPFLQMARCGGSRSKTLDISLLSHSAPFRVMARCANFPRVIEKLRRSLLATIGPRLAKFAGTQRNAPYPRLPAKSRDPIAKTCVFLEKFATVRQFPLAGGGGSQLTRPTFGLVDYLPVVYRPPRFPVSEVSEIDRFGE